MAAGKKSKKEKKAARKARKAEKKAAKRLAREAKRAAKLAAARRGPTKPAKAPAPKAGARKPKAPATKAKAGKRVASRPVVRRRVVRRKPAPAPPPLKVRQAPETLRLRSAGPSFTVDDIQRSLTFYRDVLGFTPRERWEENGELRGVELVAGRVAFWLGQDDWKKGQHRVKGVGFRMYCGTSQNVDAIADRIRATGWPLAEEPSDKPWGGRDFAVVDPDGFMITIASGL